jgi:membrane fusion protein (multidrug efflux system)
VTRRILLFALLGLVALSVAYWVYDRPGAMALVARFTPRHQAPAAPPPPPPPEVGVVEAREAEVPFPVEYAGRVAGFRDIEVRPRVGGLLLKREFEEGSAVKAGQTLFIIDPATYQVALARAQAQAQQAQATLRQTEENFARIQELMRRGVSTEKQLEDAQAARDQARAAVQLANAEIQSAQLNLGYTTVTAPAAGVTTLQTPPVGTLIQAQQTLLTTITQLDPAYVNFSFTDAEGQAFRELNQTRAKPLTEKDLTVELRYANGTVYGKTGTVDTAGQRVDPQTGTIQARAVFPNPDGAVLPGQFVRIVVRGITLPNAIVVPKQGIVQGPQGPSLYVVAANGTAEARPVRLGRELAAGWVVQEGLRPGERVVVDGVIRVRPGAPVRAVPAAPAADKTAQGSAPAATPPGGARP